MVRLRWPYARRASTGEIVGVSSQAAIDAARRLGAIDRGVPLEEAVRRDLVYLAQPVDRILGNLAILGPIAPPGCLITDAGSTKVAIVRQATLHVRAARFLGGHPMAGKESRGVESAEADLFAGRPYVLMSSEGPGSRPGMGIRRMVGSYRREGADNDPGATRYRSSVVIALTPASFDWSRVHTECGGKSRKSSVLSGPGLLDMTRLAMSSPDLWKSILDTNRQPVLTALNALIEQLTSLKTHIEDDQLVTIWREASNFSRGLRR